MWDRDDDWMFDELPDRTRFADPGGRSALRAGVRKYTCPTCKRPNQLTAEDVRRHYQCDRCADDQERGIDR